MQSNGGLVTRLVSAESLSCVCPLHALPDVAFPPVGRLGLTSPRSSVLYDATTAHGPSRRRRLSLAVPIPCRLPAFVVSLTGACPGGSPQGTPGPVVTRSPLPGMGQGDRGLSHVPAFPLGRQAPLSAPGGVLRTRPPARRTAAFQRVPTVGFPRL